MPTPHVDLPKGWVSLDPGKTNNFVAEVASVLGIGYSDGRKGERRYMPSGLALAPEFVTILTLKGWSADSIPVIASSWSPGHELYSHSPLLSVCKYYMVLLPYERKCYVTQTDAGGHQRTQRPTQVDADSDASDASTDANASLCVALRQNLLAPLL